MKMLSCKLFSLIYDENCHEPFYLKIDELAKSFLWDSYFPVHLDETLFHVLLLLSKHRQQVVPVIERTNSQLTGFISQVYLPLCSTS